jgi:phosphoglycolate phosphatase
VATTPSLIVFDLDGTLVDSHRDLADAANALLLELGAPPIGADEVSAMVGDGAAVLVRRVLRRAGLTSDARGALDRFLVHYDERLLATTRPYDGMVETLQALDEQGRRLAVLTNKPHRATLRVLEGLGLLDRFADVIGGDTDQGRKPDPAGLLTLVANARVSASNALLVGDSPVDLATARAAGTAICLARYGFGFRFKDADFDGRETFVDAPVELISILAERADGHGRDGQYGTMNTKNA